MESTQRKCPEKGCERHPQPGWTTCPEHSSLWLQNAFEPSSTAWIPLTKGMMCRVDAEDEAPVLTHRWYAATLPRGRCYARTFIGGRLVSMQAFLLQPPPGLLVDHINRNGLDNRRANLRFATRAQNLANSKPFAPSSSKYKGVSWSKERGKWFDGIQIAGRTKALGRFDREADAARAYNDAARLEWGEFAWLNPLPGEQHSEEWLTRVFASAVPDREPSRRAYYSPTISESESRVLDGNR